MQQPCVQVVCLRRLSSGEYSGQVQVQQCRMHDRRYQDQCKPGNHTSRYLQISLTSLPAAYRQCQPPCSSTRTAHQSCDTCMCTALFNPLIACVPYNMGLPGREERRA